VTSPGRGYLIPRRLDDSKPQPDLPVPNGVGFVSIDKLPVTTESEREVITPPPNHQEFYDVCGELKEANEIKLMPPTTRKQIQILHHPTKTS